MLTDEGVKQVVYSTPPALEGLAIDDLDADGTLLAPDFAVACTLGIRHLLDPARLVRRGVE